MATAPVPTRHEHKKLPLMQRPCLRDRKHLPALSPAVVHQGGHLQASFCFQLWGLCINLEMSSSVHAHKARALIKRAILTSG